jgi:hypothetical protein
MNISTNLKPDPSSEDHYTLSINGVKLGVWERSQLRQLIEDIDNVI